jgi:TPR repeat protein
MPETEEEYNQRLMKRIKANDPVAHYQMASKCQGEKDFNGAFEYYSKAAALGDVAAHYNLSISYYMGEGVEKDKKKEMHHLEEASIGGHPKARWNLGCVEQEKGRIDRAMKHWIIAAKLGHDQALKQVKEGFTHGLVSKEDFAAALRGHQAAVDATKSAQREAAVSVDTTLLYSFQKAGLMRHL